MTELRQYADEHLLYEIWMTSALTERMSRHAAIFGEGFSASDDLLADRSLELSGRNADIESFATHLRILVQFLYASKPKASDVIAANYFDRKSDWTGVRPVRPKSLMVVNQRVPVEIGHLGFGRLQRKDKTWPYESMWLDLATVIGVFLDKVPEGRVSSEFRDAANSCLVGSSKSKTIQDIVSEMGRKSLTAWAGATTATSYSITDRGTPPRSC